MTNYSPYIRTFREITEEFEFALGNLIRKVNYYNKLISKGYNVPSAGAYYSYNSLAEAYKIRQHLELEINRKYTLELTSAFEAKVVYYFKHVLNRRSPLHQAYRNIVSGQVRNGIKHMMYQHLMDVFKEQISPQDHISYTEFKNLVTYRHWLAHGRGWELPNHLRNASADITTDKFDYQYSYDVITNLMDNFPNFPNTLKE